MLTKLSMALLWKHHIHSIEIQREKANQAKDIVGQDKKTEIEKPKTSS